MKKPQRSCYDEDKVELDDIDDATGMLPTVERDEGKYCALAGGGYVSSRYVECENCDGCVNNRNPKV